MSLPKPSWTTTSKVQPLRAKRIIASLGDKALVDSAAVIAAFNGYPRAADATGIPLEDYKAEATAGLRTDLDLDNLNTSSRLPQPALRG